MKVLILVLISLNFSTCKSDVSYYKDAGDKSVLLGLNFNKKKIEKQKNHFKCVKSGSGISKCENEKFLCFKYYSIGHKNGHGGLSCFKK